MLRQRLSRRGFWWMRTRIGLKKHKFEELPHLTDPICLCANWSRGAFGGRAKARGGLYASMVPLGWLEP